MASRIGMRAFVGSLAIAIACGWSSGASAFQNNNNQFDGFFGFGTVGTVGGVKISADHVVESAPATLDASELKRLRDVVLTAADANLQTTTELRKVSVRGLYNAVEEAVRNKKPLPPKWRLWLGCNGLNMFS